MAKRGGFPGGAMPGNMSNLMKQAQRMQRQMEEGQKELETKEFTAAAGGGAVEVTVTGKKEVVKVKLAEEVVELCENDNDFTCAYDLAEPIEQKIVDLTQKIYGGDGVEFSDEAKAKIEILEKQGYGNLPICVAKTQYSFSDDATLLGAPNGFNIHVRDVKVSSGAGFIVVYTGTVMTMPGLPKIPAAENIDVDDSEKIKGLF